MSVQKLRTPDFESKVLNNNGTVLVDFYADWCGPCKMMAPIIDEIADERPDLGVFKVNVNENPDLANKYGVVSIPTLIAFKSGKETAKLVGYKPKQDILAHLP